MLGLFGNLFSERTPDHQYWVNQGKADIVEAKAHLKKLGQSKYAADFKAEVDEFEKRLRDAAKVDASSDEYRGAATDLMRYLTDLPRRTKLAVSESIDEIVNLYSQLLPLESDQDAKKNYAIAMNGYLEFYKNIEKEQKSFPRRNLSVDELCEYVKTLDAIAADLKSKLDCKLAAQNKSDVTVTPSPLPKKSDEVVVNPSTDVELRATTTSFSLR